MTGMTNSPLVSIVTVCLNSEKYVEQAIKTVLNQSYEKIEYLIIDGGSKDKTLEIVRKYEGRLRYLSEPDEGIYDAMNKGISLSRGEIVGILGSDDWYQENAVELIVKEYLKDKKIGVFLGDIILVTKNGDFRRVNGTPKLIGSYKWSRINHPTCFIKKEVYQKYRYDAKFKVCSDYDLLLKLYFAGIKFHYLNEPLVYWRTGGISGSYLTLLENYKIRKKYFGKKRKIRIFFSFLMRIIKKFILYSLFRGKLGWLQNIQRLPRSRSQ